MPDGAGTFSYFENKGSAVHPIFEKVSDALGPFAAISVESPTAGLQPYNKPVDKYLYVANNNGNENLITPVYAAPSCWDVDNDGKHLQFPDLSLIFAFYLRGH